MKKVTIIGSGLSGISCAYHLKNKGYDVEIFEMKKYPGGRANSELVNGYTCDIGFQVLLNNYSELKRLNIYKDLNLRYFDSGARIFLGDRSLSLYNPIHHPWKFLSSNFLKIFRLKDYYKIIPWFLLKSNNESKDKAGEYIEKNISKSAFRLFFKPFFKGVFLSEKLENNKFFFLKIFKKFSYGRAGLPSHGMKTLPLKIIEKNKIKVHLEHKLSDLSENLAKFENGVSTKYDFLVLALPLNEIKKITKQDIDIKYNANTTCYITSDIDLIDKSIMLIPNDSMSINSIQCLSNISSQYAPDGKHLYSISSLSLDVSEDQLRDEFKKITNLEENQFNILKTYRIKRALPAEKISLARDKNIFYCGDWATEPSIDGALKSGREVADKIEVLC